ncbi:hypothetical protein ScPMuIL_016223 [Solemya velum]
MIPVICLLLLQYLSETLAGNCTLDTSQQTVWREQDFPDPRSDVTKCGLCYRSAVCDPNALLTTFEAERLDDMLKEISENTECPSVAMENTILLAVVKEVDKYGRTLTRAQLQTRVVDFTNYLLGTKWNLGDCGAVIFVSENDRKVYTVTGSQLKRQLTDSCVEYVYNNIKSYLTDGDYYSGLRNMIGQYREILRDNTRCLEDDKDDNTGLAVGLTLGILAVLGVAAGVFMYIKRICCCSEGGRRGGGGGGGYHNRSHHYGGSHWDSGGGCGGGGGGSSDTGGGGGDF